MVSPLPEVSTCGYHLEGSGAQVILFHGLTGSPYDLRPLAQALNERDFDVTVPLLKGHGTSVADLDHITAQDWVAQGLKIINELESSRPLILGGLSMGALLALVLAQSNEYVTSLLLLSPAMRLDFSAELTISLGNLGIIPKQTHFKKLSGGSDILDPEAKKKCPSYPEMSLCGMMQLDILRMRALEQLPQCRMPIFCAFGEQDQAIDSKGSWRLIHKSVKSALFSKFYSRSKHIVTLDYDRDRLSNDVVNFLHHNVAR